MKELREDIAVMGMPFTYADSRRLDRYAEAIEPFYCNFCGSCEAGCPRGVEISTVNRSLMYVEGGYRNLALGRATYAELQRQARATACSDCEGCTARCINGLDVAARMERARMVLA